jgi:hypothetical protein
LAGRRVIVILDLADQVEASKGVRVGIGGSDRCRQLAG